MTTKNKKRGACMPKLQLQLLIEAGIIKSDSQTLQMWAFIGDPGDLVQDPKMGHSRKVLSGVLAKMGVLAGVLAPKFFASPCASTPASTFLNFASACASTPASTSFWNSTFWGPVSGRRDLEPF